MTKAAICTHCMDIVSPYRNWETNRTWRWCSCDHTAVRWRDGHAGLLEVTSLHGASAVRVLGLANGFFEPAVRGISEFGHNDAMHEWRALHDAVTEQVAPTYLFHDSKRKCWAVVVRPGETSDVKFVQFADVRLGERVPAPA